jgi:hypothetical protein
VSEKDIAVAVGLLTGGFPFLDTRLGPESGVIGYPTPMQVAIDLCVRGIPHHFDPSSNEMPLTATLAFVFGDEVKTDRLGRDRHYPRMWIRRRNLAGMTVGFYGPCTGLRHNNFWNFVDEAFRDDADYLCGEVTRQASDLKIAP